MRHALPPLNALRAFEAAARHLSLTKAAEELHVTPAALSHQVRGLEEALGVRLFQRLPRALALTDAGRKLLPGLSSGFSQIRQAVALVQETGGGRVLVVSTPPGFTSKWLAPRLHRFLTANPDIEVRVSSTLKNADFETDGVDVAVRNLRHSQPVDQSLFSEHLVDLGLVPVCSPAFLAAHPELVSPSDLAKVPLVHDNQMAGRLDNPGWPEWLAAAGVDGVSLGHGVKFNSADHALEAALEGAGVLLAHSVLASDDLKVGRLVSPFPMTIAMRRSFRIVCPIGHETRANIRTFRDWIHAEMAASGGRRFDVQRRAGLPAAGM
ncbi:MAG TPA: transcriptional regulator GcvA [Hyphomicrobiaceae bacterium]|nr:transcriptional regulator GcvA [Hyphomicrobiaceae bacterium]